MTAQLAYPHIEKCTGRPACLQRIPRVRVAQIVMDYLAHGWSPDELCRQHPYLRHAEAHAAMAYYYDHPHEIEQEIQEELQEVDAISSQIQRSPLFHRLRAQRSR